MSSVEIDEATDAAAGFIHPRLTNSLCLQESNLGLPPVWLSETKIDGNKTPDG